MRPLYKLNRYIYDKRYNTLNTEQELIYTYISRNIKYIHDLINSIVVERTNGLYYITMLLNYYNHYYDSLMINFLPVRSVKDIKIKSIKYSSDKCRDLDYFNSNTIEYKFGSPKKKVIVRLLDQNYRYSMIYEHNKLKRVIIQKIHGSYRVYKFKYEEELVRIDIKHKHKSVRYIKC